GAHPGPSQREGGLRRPPPLATWHPEHQPPSALATLCARIPLLAFSGKVHGPRHCGRSPRADRLGRARDRLLLQIQRAPCGPSCHLPTHPSTCRLSEERFSQTDPAGLPLIVLLAEQFPPSATTACPLF